jgi:putative spermidine/putrescine transport system permease protein
MTGRPTNLVVTGGMAPALLVIILLVAVPSVSVFISALTSEADSSFDISNFVDLFSNGYFLQAFWRTIRIAVAVTVVTIIGGYPLALFIARARPLVASIALSVVVFPLMVSTVARTFGWIVVLGGNGLVNQLLGYLGIVDEALPLLYNDFAIIVGETHLLLPYMVISLLAVMQRADPNLEEAAHSLGASPLRTFFLVTLPLTRAGLLAGIMLVMSLGMMAFATPLILGGARAPVLTTVIYRQVFVTFDWKLAASAAIVLTLMALSLILLLGMAARRSTEREIA